MQIISWTGPRKISPSAALSTMCSTTVITGTKMNMSSTSCFTGRQECCRGSENFHLDVDDVILVPPGVGHASMGSQVDTIAFVLHFSASAFKPLLKKGGIYDFPSCRSDETTRDEPRYRHLRFYASRSSSLPSRAGPTPSWGSKPVWSFCSLPFALSSPLPCSIPCPRMNNAGCRPPPAGLRLRPLRRKTDAGRPGRLRAVQPHLHFHALQADRRHQFPRVPDPGAVPTRPH